MPYQKINWQNGEAGGTPLNATNLNKMDAQIDANTTAIATNTADIAEIKRNTEFILTSASPLNGCSASSIVGIDVDGCSTQASVDINTSGISNKNISADGSTYNQGSQCCSFGQPIDVAIGSQLVFEIVGTYSGNLWAYVGKWNGSTWVEREMIGAMTNNKVSYTVPSGTNKIYFFATATSFNATSVKCWDSTPTPTNPIPIVDASEDVIAHTKNLVPYTVKSGTFNDVAYTISNDGTVTLNGKASASGTLDFFRSTTEIPSDWEKGKKYIFGAKFINNTNVGEAHFDTYPYINGAWDTSNDVVLNDTGEVEWTIPNNAVGFLCRIGTQGGKTYNNLIIKPYIYEASNKITLPYTLRSVGNIKDELIVNADGGSKTVGTNEITVSYSDLTFATASGRAYATFDIPSALKNISNEIVCASDMFSGRAQSGWESDDRYICTWFSATKGFISAPSEVSQSDFQTLMNGKSFKYRYVLATPTTTTLTASEVSAIRQLQTYSGTTIIDSALDVKSVTYHAGVKEYIDWRFEQLATLMLGEE